jgi:hypothetical protein
MLVISEAVMRFLKRFLAVVGLLGVGVFLSAAPHAGERGKERVEATSTLVELTPPRDKDDVWRKEVVLCWEAAVDKGSRFAVNDSFTPPDLGKDKQANWELFQVPGLAVEIDKRRTEELACKLAGERVTVVVLALSYHRKFQAGSWSFGVHRIPPRSGGLRLLGKVRVLIEEDKAKPSGQKNARPGEKSP